MSRKIIETFWSWYNAGIDRTEIRALIECDTLTDLPSPDAISGYRLTIGTTAHVIDTNAVYMMQSGGAWKVQSAGTDVYTKAETDALIASSIKSDVFAAGEAIPDTADINDYSTPGIYTRDSVTNTGISNLPATISTGFGFKLYVEYVSNGERLTQKVQPSWNRCIYYIRQRYRNTQPPDYEEGSAWSEWKPITPYGSIGTQITASTNIRDLAPGFYFCNDSSLLLSSTMPSDYTAANAVIEVTNTITTSRKRITLYPASFAPDIWVCTMSSGSSWSNWYKFSGTAV